MLTYHQASRELLQVGCYILLIFLETMQQHGMYSVHRYCKKPLTQQSQSTVFLRAAITTPDLQKLGLLIPSIIHTLLQEDQPKNTGRPNKGQS